MNTPPTVALQEWEAARQRLLVKEKEPPRPRDALAAERRRMPWLPVEKDYLFDGPNGRVSLLDLFEGRRQLIVYRAFFEPGVFGWPDHACRGCSLVADQVADVAHLHARDTTLTFVSRAPQQEIERMKARMGWTMPWYTMTDGFDADFGVDEWHGTNAFIRDDDGNVFRTYFINNRGDEALGSTWSYLDMTALGRQEECEDSPEGYPQTPPYVWWNWHDEYEEEPAQGWLAQVAGATGGGDGRYPARLRLLTDTAHEEPSPADRRRPVPAGPDGGGRRHRLRRAAPGGRCARGAVDGRRPGLPPLRRPSVAPAAAGGLGHARRPVPGDGSPSRCRGGAPGRRVPAWGQPRGRVTRRRTARRPGGRRSPHCWPVSASSRRGAGGSAVTSPFAASLAGRH